MKSEISITDYWVDKSQVTALKRLGFDIRVVHDHLEVSESVVYLQDISTLDELLNISRDLNEKLIISISDDDDTAVLSVEIYNGYRE